MANWLRLALFVYLSVCQAAMINIRDINATESEINVGSSTVDDEGFTQEDAAEASIDETSSGEKKYISPTKKTDIAGHNYEITLQKLQKETENVNGTNLKELELDAALLESEEDPSIEDLESTVQDTNDTVPVASGIKSRRKRQLAVEPFIWEKGIIPVSFTAGLTQESFSGKLNIKKAIKFYEDNTCLRFPTWTTATKSQYGLSHNNYLIFIKGSGCFSFLGNDKNANGQDISACGSSGVGVVLHEIGHAVGLEHEMERADRNQYVETHPENAETAYKKEFSGFNEHGYTLFHKYDFASRMHYNAYDFTWSGRPTITVVDQDNAFLLDIGRGDKLSYYDIMAISKGYKCKDRCPSDKQSLVCENDGFVTRTNGVCGCRCVVGLQGPTCNEIKKNPETGASWPAGSYGLPMGIDGCPTAAFSEGSHYHVMEGSSYISRKGILKSTVEGSFIEDRFCMIDVPQTASSTTWGKGEYCIYMKAAQPCPNGFSLGLIFYDDVNSAKNKKSGSVPQGVYKTQYTAYAFCCREDGEATTPIVLPSEKPFVLFSKDNLCQSVVGMFAIKFHIRYDTVKSSTPRSHYNPPEIVDQNGDVFQMMCYYQKMNYDCGEMIDLSESNPSQVITSSNYPSNYNNLEECNWLIKSPCASKIHIEVEDLDIEDDSTHRCVDSLEIRHNLLGTPGNRFCGKGMKRSILSDENRVMLTFRANEKDTRKGFKAKLTMIKDTDMCYNMKDNGASYRGNVDYTQTYQRCVSWEKTKHCRVNPFSEKFMDKGLVGNNNCRNPNNALRPWCYINEFCEMNMCDVCGIENCFDVFDDCEERIHEDAQYCSSDNGFAGCHKACGFCSQGHPGENFKKSCSLPTPIDDDATVVKSSSSQTSVPIGESIKLECSQGNQKGSSELTCMSDGSYEGLNPFCHISCPEGWLRNNDQCYKLFKEKKYFKDASAICEQEGARVTDVLSESENEFLKGMVVAGNVDSAYIGLIKKYHGWPWAWVGGATLAYTNWLPKHDALLGNHCTRIKSTGQWTATLCKYKYPSSFICKKQFTGTDKPCIDERTDCKETLTQNPDVCQKFPAFASRYCRLSCGVCSEFKCNNPGAVANAQLHENANSVDGGAFVKYTCNSNFALKSGNLQRACVGEDSLTGQPPLCTPKSEHQETVGFRVIDRTADDSGHKLTIYDTEKTRFPRNGEVSVWELFNTKNTEIRVQVWRPRQGYSSQFIFIGENTLQLHKDGVNKITVPVADRIKVRAGDLIGWYFPKYTDGMSYDKCADDYASYKVHQYSFPSTTSARTFTVGRTSTISLKANCRIYSIAAILSPE